MDEKSNSHLCNNLPWRKKTLIFGCVVCLSEKATFFFYFLNPWISQCSIVWFFSHLNHVALHKSEKIFFQVLTIFRHSWVSGTYSSAVSLSCFWASTIWWLAAHFVWVCSEDIADIVVKMVISSWFFCLQRKLRSTKLTAGQWAKCWMSRKRRWLTKSRRRNLFQCFKYFGP